VDEVIYSSISIGVEMASASTTTLDAALKEYYLPPAREQLNNENMMLAQIERTSRHVEGRRAVLSLHVQRNSGVGARAEGGACRRKSWTFVQLLAYSSIWSSYESHSQ
jgi:hypothetical protein